MFALINNNTAIPVTIEVVRTTSMLDGTRAVHEVAVPAGAPIPIKDLPADVQAEVNASDYHGTGEHRIAPDGHIQPRLVVYRGEANRHGPNGAWGYNPPTPIDGVNYGAGDRHAIINSVVA